MSSGSERTEIEYSLLINAEGAYGDIRKIEIIMMRCMSIVQRFTGGNPDLANAIAMMQKTIMWIRHLQMVIHAFEAATGPLGWIYAAVTAVSFALTTTDAMADGMRVVE